MVQAQLPSLESDPHLRQAVERFPLIPGQNEINGCENSLRCKGNGKEKSGFVITFRPTLHYVQNI